FPGYFLVVADFIMWAKNNGIAVGPGRGSGRPRVSFLHRRAVLRTGLRLTAPRRTTPGRAQAK
ncbi:hypothetical protein AB0B79_37945, partial [Streptomyces sp. NPDC039022]|uniref:hypothetical protein n=1 Tax=Streptomyces sp. NPDC039022 TaxID=3157091 RepID=UPI00340FD358